MTTTTTYPSRHRAQEARGARIGRPLRVLGRVRHVDEQLLDEIGRGYLRVDDAGARVAEAFGAPLVEGVCVGGGFARRRLARPKPP